MSSERELKPITDTPELLYIRGLSHQLLLNANLLEQKGTPLSSPAGPEDLDFFLHQLASTAESLLALRNKTIDKYGSTALKTRLTVADDGVPGSWAPNTF